MKKIYYEKWMKWVKMPKRETKEWYDLMGIIMKNFRYTLANVYLINPELSGFTYKHQKMLKKYRNYNNIPFHVFLQKEYRYGINKMALGIFLYDIQEYMKPFVKISKAKLAKEFRYFLLECKAKYIERLRTITKDAIFIHKYNHNNACDIYFNLWYPNLSNRSFYPNKERLEKLSKYKSSGILSNITTSSPVVMVCKTNEGKGVLGKVVGSYPEWERLKIREGRAIPRLSMSEPKKFKFIRYKEKETHDISNSTPENPNIINDEVIPATILDLERVKNKKK